MATGFILGFIVAIAAVVAIITPLLPFAIVGFLLWTVLRSFSRPVTA